jgi:NAD(P)-dependent dehydrogenase (short-subunit alcohol dehydrogenase family)
MSMIRRSWLVTGTSQGFGLATVKELLAQGYQVAATTRSLDSLLSSLGTTTAHPNLLPLEVNLSSERSIWSAVNAAIERFGQLDVLVNNAGYGASGAIEEFTRADILKQYDVNFLAPHAFIRSALPHFRARRNGYILNISSIAAFNPSPNWGVYASAKAALTALSDALGDEVRPLGVRVTAVMPGPFRTNFRKALGAPEAEIADYAHVHDAKKKLFASRQPGDPAKAAKLFITLANSPDPPKWIFLGAIAVQRALEKNAAIQKEVAQWRDVGLATDASD